MELIKIKMELIKIKMELNKIKTELIKIKKELIKTKKGLLIFCIKFHLEYFLIIYTGIQKLNQQMNTFEK